MILHPRLQSGDVFGKFRALEAGETFTYDAESRQRSRFASGAAFTSCTYDGGEQSTTPDYTDQRFYASSYGRFNTPDPYMARGASSGSVNNPGDPGSWNRYAYTRGDPINRNDAHGMDDSDCGTDRFDRIPVCDDGDSGDPCFDFLFPDPACYLYQPLAPVPQGARATAAPVWDIDVGYTPVTTANGAQYDHLFIWVHLAGVTPSSTLTAANSVVYDGGPSISCGYGGCGSVTEWESVTGQYNEVGNANMVDFSSQTISPYLQGQLQIDFTSLSSSSGPSYHLLGPNSNSVVFTLLQDIGVSVPAISQTSTSLGTPAGTLNFNGVTQYFTGWGWYLPH